MSEPIVYLDNNATTRVDPRVIDEMLPFFGESYGNPSSTHRFGAGVAAQLEEARGRVAGLIGARDSEIVFTSGGTEADNAALRGVLAARPSKRHIVISAVEHHAVLDMASLLERGGLEVTRVAVDANGSLDVAGLEASLREDTALVSIMLANNETGVVFPLKEVCRIAKARGVCVHTDAVQAVGKMPVNVDELGVDLLSLSAHKIYGPKGVGALYLRRGTPFRAMMIGGHQERDRRGGTQNAAGIVGLGKACELLSGECADEHAHVRELRDLLERRITERFDNARVMGGGVERLLNTACVCFAGIEAEAALLLLSERGFCASSGAACASGSLDPSHVLAAMGVEPHIAQGEIRFSLGRFSSEADVDALLDAMPAVVEKLAALNMP